MGDSRLEVRGALEQHVTRGCVRVEDAAAKVFHREGRTGIRLAPGCDVFVAHHVLQAVRPDQQGRDLVGRLELHARIDGPAGCLLLVLVHGFDRGFGREGS